MNVLQGYRTYLVAVAIIVLSLLFVCKVIDLQTFLGLLGILNGSGLVTLRAGVKADTTAVAQGELPL